MKTNLLKTVLAGAALLVSSAVCAQVELAENVKNYFAVTGYNANGDEVTVSSTVYDGYGFTVQLPATNNAVVKADKVRVDIAIQDVNSVGAKGELRQYSKEFETGASAVSGDLHKLMKSCYNFPNNQGGVTAPITVIDGNKTQKFTYNIIAYKNDNTIVGTPDNESNARAAWAIITSNMKSFKKSTYDTFVGVKKGAYLEVAGERLTYTQDENLCEEPWTTDGVKTTILRHTELTEVETTAEDSYKAYLYLPAGSALAVGCSESILQKDALITLDLSALYMNQGALPKQISQLMEDMKNPSEAVFSFIKTFDNLVGLIGSAKNVPVTVEFTPVQASFTVYPGSAEAQYNQTITQLMGYQAKYPNTMAVQMYGESTQLNNVIELVDGEYVCNNFVLTDLSENPVLGFADKTSWYSPVDFTAVEGSYKRVNVNNGYASAVLPFAVTSEMLAGSEILTYANYDGAYVATFTTGSEAEAGVPFIADATGEDWDITFDNTAIKAELANGNATYGTYLWTDEYAEAYYGVKASLNKFTPLANYLYPFRACLDLNAVVSDASIKGISIQKIATGIKNIETSNAANTIYSINGAKVNKISQPGLYIVNGKKMFVK